MPCPQSRDRGERALPLRERGLGLFPQARPGVGAGPPPLDGAPERPHGLEVRIERSRARTSETPVRTPGAQQRDGKVAPGIGAQERDGVMPLAEPDPNTVSELTLESHPTSAIQANGTNRLLERHPTSFVERRQTRHAPSVSARGATGPCRAATSRCRSPHRTHDADPDEPQLRSRAARRCARVGSGAVLSPVAPAGAAGWGRSKWHSRRVPFGRRVRFVRRTRPQGGDSTASGWIGLSVVARAEVAPWRTSHAAARRARESRLALRSQTSTRAGIRDPIRPSGTRCECHLGSSPRHAPPGPRQPPRPLRVP